MTFPEIFLTFVQHEIPVSHEKYESIERSIITFDVKQYQGNNVTAMVAELRRLIKCLVTARMWDSKNNSQLCRTLIDAGGPDNQEYTNPLYIMLEKIKKEIAKTGHMNNEGKIKEMTKAGVGWKDILERANEIYSGMATPGNVRWPPALNPRDSKTPSSKYSNQANLTQFGSNDNRKSKPNKRGSRNGKHRGKSNNGNVNGNGNDKNGRSKNSKKRDNKGKRTPRSNKFSALSITDQPYNHINGTPVYCRTINDKKYEWCTP